MPNPRPELTEEQQATAKALVKALHEQNLEPRRDEVRRIRTARAFFRGIHYGWWDEQQQLFRPLTDTQGLRTPSEDEEEASRYTYVENRYQQHGLSLMAQLTSGVPKPQFGPQDPRDPVDVETAMAAEPLAEFVAEENNVEELVGQVAYYLFNDAGLGGYVRHIVDGDAFGYDEKPNMVDEEGVIEPGKFACSYCGGTYGEEEIRQQYGAVPGEFTEEGPLAPDVPCPDEGCGYPLGEKDHLPPVTGMVSVQRGTKRVPRAREVITIVGNLELNRPAAARNFDEMGWLTWETEVSTAKIRSLYPEYKKSAGGYGSASADESRAREARLRDLSGTRTGSTDLDDVRAEMETFSQTWIRPWQYHTVGDEEKVTELKQLFPDGMRVVLAGDFLCHVDNEAMQEYWRLFQAYPGDGQMREAIGWSIIDPQKRLNTERNIATETFERCLPITAFDANAINADAYKAVGNAPGASMGVNRSAGEPMGNHFYTTPPPTVSPQMLQDAREQGGPVMDALTGDFPALFGGDTGANDTKGGIEIARNQALQRVGLVYRPFKTFWAELMLLGVRCLLKNRSGEIVRSITGPSGSYEARVIQLDRLSGRMFAKPESDEAYPTPWVEKRSMYARMLESGNPLLRSMSAHPANAAAMSRVMAWKDLYVPGVDARAKTFRMIGELLKQPPAEIPASLDQQTGQENPASQAPSIEPNYELDDHETAMATIMEWFNQPAAREEELKNPQGFSNVLLFYRAHKQMSQAKQMEQAATAMAAAQAQGMASAGAPQPAPAPQEEVQ